MKIRLALVLAALSAPGCLPAGTVRHRFEHGGRTRTYNVHTPPELPTGPVPLVLVLHGALGTGRQMERMSQMSVVADEEGFVAVYPDGIRRVWNDGRNDETLRDRVAIDDVGFLLAVLDRVGVERPIDTARVFATGISNGAFMCHRLANDHAVRFAAIAPVVGGMSYVVSNEFGPAHPISVYVIQGTADPLVPFNGGDIGFAGSRKARGKILDTRRAVRLWWAHNGCEVEPERSDLANTEPDDGCLVRRERWTGGAAGTAVQLDTIDGGGHAWPGGPQYLPKAVIGPVCRDYHASRAIWKFFQDNPRSLTPPRGDD